MRIVTFASGSTGNCSLISDGGVNILLDAGISARRIEKSLEACGVSPHDLCGVLITHEHSDHISGLPLIVKRYGLPVYAPSLLCSALRRAAPDIEGSLRYIPVGESFSVGDISVRAFRTPHDAAFSVGYRFEGSAVLAFATDTGCVTDDMIDGLTGADIALIESNHDPDMLRCGPYPYPLKRRILSEYGHLSNIDCAKLALHLAKSGTKHIILGHLSRENNRPERALGTVEAELAGFDAKVYVAPMAQLLSVGEL